MMPTGWCPGDGTMPAMLALYPHTSAVRIFFGPGDGLPASAWSTPAHKLAQAPADADLVVSHKDVDVDAAAFVDAWVATGRTGRLILIPHHEPEQQTGGDPTPAQFRASWTRQRQQVGDHPARAEGRLRLAACWTLQWIRAGGNWRTWWPDHEADAVDLVLFDWYPYAPGTATPFRPRTYEDPASALATMLEIAAATGKDWGIGEINHQRITQANGFAVDLDPTGEACAAWYRRMHAAAKAAGCRVWTHFHRGGGDLTSRLPEQQALRDLIEQEASMTRVKSLGGHPIEQYNSPNVGGTMSAHKGPVLHIAEGTYRGTISWQMNPDQRYGDGTSVTTASSWVVGRNTGEWAQMTDSDRIAWCQRGGSRERSSIELAGHAPDGPTPWQIEACAQILAWEHRTYGVPLAVADDPSEGGLGHHSMDREWLGEEWGHDSCPGAGVIAAKGAIVARAKQIINGEDDDVSTQDVITGLYVALARAANPEAVTDAEDAKVARQTRDAIRSIMQPVAAQEGTSAAELKAGLAGLPKPEQVDVDGLAAAVAERVKASLPEGTPISDEQLKRVLRDLLGSLNDAPQG